MLEPHERCDVAVLVAGRSRYRWMSPRLQYRLTAARYLELLSARSLRLDGQRVELADLTTVAPDLEAMLTAVMRRVGRVVFVDELFWRRTVDIGSEARASRRVAIDAGLGVWTPGGFVARRGRQVDTAHSSARVRRLLPARWDEGDDPSDRLSRPEEAVIAAMLRAGNARAVGSPGTPGAGTPGFTGIGT